MANDTEIIRAGRCQVIWTCSCDSGGGGCRGEDAGKPWEIARNRMLICILETEMIKTGGFGKGSEDCVLVRRRGEKECY